jgi:uncharacterized membrane protein YhaH (DUF805 family)
MKWYLKVFRQYADFSGRARRKEYWMFVLFNFIVMIVAVIADNVFELILKGAPYGALYGTLYSLYAAAVLIPALAVAVRRLHDTGKSGWWILINLIPLVGFIWFLVLTLTAGQSGDNPYGDNPKEYDGYGERRKKRNVAVTLVLAACFLFISLLNALLPFWQQGGEHVNLFFWTVNVILPGLIPAVALLVTGNALLRKDDRITGAITLLIASGVMFLYRVLCIYDIVSIAERLRKEGNYLFSLLFQTTGIIEAVTLGIAGLALLLSKVKLRNSLLIASCLFILMYAVARIYSTIMMSNYQDNFTGYLTIVAPVALLLLAYAMLPGRKGAEEADETQAEDHHSDAATPSLPVETSVPASRETTESKAHYKSIARELACYVSFLINDSKEQELQARLLAGGDVALDAISDFLLACGRGSEKDWWHNVRRLVLLIKQFSGKGESVLNVLIKQESNIWEYQTQVKDVAKEELEELRTANKPVTKDSDVHKTALKTDEKKNKEIKTYSNPDRATHINMATNDLYSIFGTAALGGNIDKNREWIRNVGQDLYDTHGFSAMQEVFIKVKSRYPVFQAKLSAMWDGVGGWAD